MSVNVDLLQRTLAYIEAHPEEWDQTEWRCGATACVAGHAAILGGCRWANADDPDDADVITPSGEVVFVRTAAYDLLGLTSASDSALFHGANTLNDLRQIVGAIVARAASC